MSEYIYIISNACYGGFGMKPRFLIELFKFYAHSPEILSKIFNIQKIKENFDLQTEIDKYNKYNNVNKDKSDENDNEIDDEIDNEIDDYNKYIDDYNKYIDDYNKNIDYFLDYVIIKNNIYDLKNNTYIYISSYCTELRSNQYVIEYIFERSVKKIINNNQFTPYFYNLLSFYEPAKYCTKLENNQIDELIDITSELENDILTYNINNNKPIKKRRNLHITENKNKNKNIDDYKFYKNGVKKISDNTSSLLGSTLDVKRNSYYKFNFDTNITKDNIYDIFEKYDFILENILFDDINDNYASLICEKIKNCYKWKIHEYDGTESIELELPYDTIIEDLLNNLWQTENYINKSILSEFLINKKKDLSQLKKYMYEDEYSCES
jgi:hypothetical protein